MTMGDYVDFSRNPADLIIAAENIARQGMALSSHMEASAKAIHAEENDPGTFTKNEYSEAFLKNYHSQPVLDAGNNQGPNLMQLGQNAADAIWNYIGQDDENGAGFGDWATQVLKGKQQ